MPDVDCHPRWAIPFTVTLLFPALAQAAAGEDQDAVNNIISDFGPILSLFGEQFAKQYLSESMTWLDNVIFAMAPLGIITAIVSAIRVGGPAWLKAIIGRARENRAAAEVELMSSTSDEVCELWNGRGMVRTLGRPNIKQLVYIEGMDDEEEASGWYTLETAPGTWSELFENHLWGSMRSVFCLLQLPVIPWPLHRTEKANATRSSSSDPEKGQPGEQPNFTISDQDISEPANSTKTGEWRPDARDLRSAPNVSLNIHRGGKSRDLWIGACCGVVIQAAVVVFTGFTVYHPRMKTRFMKGEGPVDPYAFPLFLVGTVILVTGLVMCSAVIEQSTAEAKWIPNGRDSALEKDGTGATDGSLCTGGDKVKESPPNNSAQQPRVRLVWLQQQHVVSDQTFDSYAIFAPGTTDRVLLSKRSKIGQDSLARGNVSQPRNTAKADASKSWMRTQRDSLAANLRGTEPFTVLAALLSIIGFIVQFIGQRGLNWTTAVAQLTAVGAMTLVRAWVRRGLVQRPMVQRTSKAHELDWLAVQFSLDRNFWGYYGGECDSPAEGSTTVPSTPHGFTPKQEFSWRIRAGMDNLATPGHWGPAKDTSLTDTDKILRVRRRLGHLIQWTPEPIQKAANQLGDSIELVMNTIFTEELEAFDEILKSFGVPRKDAGRNIFTWSVDVETGSADELYDPRHVCCPKKNIIQREAAANMEHPLCTCTQKCHFTVQRINGKWKADIGQLEAALSLWVYTLQKQHGPFQAKGTTGNDDELQRESEENLAGKPPDSRRGSHGSLERHIHMVLGDNQSMRSLKRDMAWFTNIRQGTSKAEFFNPTECTSTHKHLLPTCAQHCIWLGYRGFKPCPDSVAGEYLIITLPDGLETALTRHMFFGFMWAISEKVPAYFANSTETTFQNFRKPTTSRDDFDGTWSLSDCRYDIWYSDATQPAGVKKIMLQNQELDKLVAVLGDTGIDTSEQILHYVIPPLGEMQKLPVERLVDAFLDNTRRDEERLVGDCHDCTALIYLMNTYEGFFREFCCLNAGVSTWKYSDATVDRFVLKAAVALLDFVLVYEKRFVELRADRRQIFYISPQIAAYHYELSETHLRSPGLLETLQLLYLLHNRPFHVSEVALEGCLLPPDWSSTKCRVSQIGDPRITDMWRKLPDHRKSEYADMEIFYDALQISNTVQRVDFEQTLQAVLENGELSELLRLTPLHEGLLHARTDCREFIQSCLRNELVSSVCRKMINQADIMGWTPVHYEMGVCRHGTRTRIYQPTLELDSFFHPDSKAQLDMRGTTPLHYYSITMLHSFSAPSKGWMADNILYTSWGVESLTIKSRYGHPPFHHVFAREPDLYKAGRYFFGPLFFIDHIAPKMWHPGGVTFRFEHSVYSRDLHHVLTTASGETIFHVLAYRRDGTNLALGMMDYAYDSTSLYRRRSMSEFELFLLEWLCRQNNEGQTCLHNIAARRGLTVFESSTDGWFWRFMQKTAAIKDSHGCVPLDYELLRLSSYIPHIGRHEYACNDVSGRDRAAAFEAYIHHLKANKQGTERDVAYKELRKTSLAVSRLLEAQGNLHGTETTPLQLALSEGPLMAAVLLSEFRTDSENKNKKSTLHYVAECGNSDMGSILMDRGTISGWQRDVNGRTAFLTALHYRNWDIADQLYSYCMVAANVADLNGINSLLLAVDSRHEAWTRRLLEPAGAGTVDSNASDNAGRTPLHVAAFNGFTVGIRMLLQCKADARVTDAVHGTPMHSAIYSISQRTLKGKRDPLVLAAALENMELLLGAYPELLNSPDSEGFTPLVCSCGLNIMETTLFLLERGADVNVCSQYNLTALHYAVKLSTPRLVSLLIQRGANVDVRATDGSTPLYEAVLNENREMVALLMRAGANRHLPGPAGKTPMQLAEELGLGYTCDIMERMGKQNVE